MDGEGLFELAKTLEKQGHKSRAIEKYTEFIKHHSRAGDDGKNQQLALAYNNRGFLKYLEVDFEGAIQDYTDSISLNGLSAITYYNRGTIHYRMSRFVEAINDLKKSLELKPDFDQAKTGLFHAENDKMIKEMREY